MKIFRWAFPLLLWGGLLVSFFPASPCLGGLQQQDENIRKFIQAAAANDKAGACQSLGISSDDGAGVDLVQMGVKTLGGKKIDDITRLSFEYNWTNGTETLNATYHIRTGNEGFYLYFASKSVDKKPPTLDLSFEKTEPNPFEVRAINFTSQHWGILLSASLLAVFLLVLLGIWMIRRLMYKNRKPPQIPAS